MLKKNTLGAILVITMTLGFNISSADEEGIFEMTSPSANTGESSSFFSRIFGNSKPENNAESIQPATNNPAPINSDNKSTTPTAVVAPPKPKTLPNDPSIRIRPHSNNPTIDKNLRVSLQNNYMKEAVRWYGEGAGVNTMDASGRGLLYLAIQRRHTDAVKFLLLRRADVNQRNNDGSLPLQTAVTSGQSDVVKMLLERNAEVVKLPSGETMIHHVVRKGYEEIALSLMEKGVDVNKIYGNGNTLLHIASARGMHHTVNALISRGANVNAKNNDDITPLHEAAAKGHLAVVTTLTNNNANVKALTRKKWTPLHHAARFGQKDVVLHLLSKGASSNVINSDGNTPFALAKHLNHLSVTEILDSRTTVARNGRSGSSSRNSGWFW